MREFSSMTEFAVYLGELALAQHIADKALLTRAATVVQIEAKRKIGAYQPGAGPFAPWAPLADSTVAEKERLGYVGQVSDDDPLLRTGGMRDSIEKNADAAEAFVGSDDDKAVWQELGTRRIPPRSFLGSAAVEKTPEILRIMGAGTTLFLQGGGVMGGSGLRLF